MSAVNDLLIRWLCDDDRTGVDDNGDDDGDDEHDDADSDAKDQDKTL